LYYGGFGDCTAFNNDGSKIKIFGELLTNGGFHSSGNDILYNGMTGEQIETEIFMGPTYYMRLKHMVKDKINYRSLGPRTALTRQPVSGRANDGGLRIGEMERDAVIGHGISAFLRESMMERGDKYFMAVCNNTGMVAIYNPAKNLFMSPMADGPIKFVGSLDNQTMRVENITKFGRDFSIICVPYTLKLLIQELQTINIQMRLITEDNIEQLENMSYSKNIDKLLHTDGFDAKTYINNMNQQLNKSATNVLQTSDTPDSPFYIINNKSPLYPLGSPSDSPIVFPETPEGSPPESSAFIPTSPFYSPNSPLFSPTSPEMPPPNTNPLDILTEKAQQYNTGDQVFLRGDTLPSRIWSVTKIGDRMLTIETTNFENLPPSDNIKVVTADDIMPYDANLINNPAQPPPFEQTGGYPIASSQQPMTYGGGMMPAINFAPQFKIMNGGSDFSTDPTTTVTDTAGNNNFGLPDINNLSPPPSSTPQVGGETKNIEESSSSALDFSKFLIQKLGV
jgi:hypothetical protein